MPTDYEELKDDNSAPPRMPCVDIANALFLGTVLCLAILKALDFFRYLSG